MLMFTNSKTGVTQGCPPTTRFQFVKIAIICEHQTGILGLVMAWQCIVRFVYAGGIDNGPDKVASAR